MVKSPPVVQKTQERHRFDPWVRELPRRRRWQPAPVSCLGNAMDSGGWRAAVHGVAEAGTA